METYNKRSLCLKYCSQGVQTSFYESTPSAGTPVGNLITTGTRRISGHEGENIPNAPEERHNRGASRFPRILLERIPVMQSLRRVASSHRLKKTEHSHSRTSFSHDYYKLSSEYRKKRRLCLQNRSAACVFLRSNTSQQQEVSQVCLRKQGLSVLSTSLWSEHSPSDLYSSGAYCDRLPPSSGDFSYPLPRRLVSAPSRWSSVTQPQVSATRYAKTGGVYTKREKVRIGPCPGYPVLGSSVAPGSGESSPPRFQGSRDCSLGTRVTISKNPVIS